MTIRRSWQYALMLAMALAAGHSIGAVIVITVLDALSRAGSERLIIDLVRLPDAGQRRETANYQGIGW